MERFQIWKAANWIYFLFTHHRCVWSAQTCGTGRLTKCKWACKDRAGETNWKSYKAVIPACALRLAICWLIRRKPIRERAVMVPPVLSSPSSDCAGFFHTVVWLPCEVCKTINSIYLFQYINKGFGELWSGLGLYCRFPVYTGNRWHRTDSRGYWKNQWGMNNIFGLTFGAIYRKIETLAADPNPSV